ncbi:hypothetical protein KA005_19350, partial [bacterium]|nr:hypothetical protein [bacterium]
MKIAVHHNLQEHSGSFSSKWIQCLNEIGVETVALDFKHDGVIDAVRGCDGAMWHWFHVPDDKQSAPKVLDAIEFGLRIPVFPNHATRFHYDEKIAQHYFLESINAPCTKTWVFWKKDEALDFLDTVRFPLVFKLSAGAGSSNVYLLKNREEAQSRVEEMFGNGIYPCLSRNETVLDRLRRKLIGEKHWYYHVHKNYVYFQEFLPGNNYDIRVTIIGNRAFGYIRHNRDDDFRASGSGKPEYDPSKIPMDAVSIAHKVSQENGFQSMAYDFLFNKDGDVSMTEISYCYVDHMVHSCLGYWDR